MGEWRGLMQPFSFLPVEVSGRPWWQREAGRRRRARSALVRVEEEGGRLGRVGGKIGRLEKKERGPWLGRKAGRAESDGENSFPNKIWFLHIPRLWKFSQVDLGRILTWGFFLNSSRLLKDFRKLKYAMPCYATLGKIN
jgi:hypothetical protein